MLGAKAEGAGGLVPGDHACLVCESAEERWATIAEFVRSGHAHGERTLFVAAAGNEAEAVARLGSGAAVGGELIVAPASLAMGYADGATFDPEERERVWREQVRAALADGFTGLRVVGDMKWFTEIDLELDGMLDYERRCTAVTRDLPATALCVYDRGSFSDRTLAHVGHAHPICRGSTIAPAGVFVSRTMEIAAAGPGVLELSGEIDVSNVPSLSSALHATAGGRTTVLLDFAELEFIDVAGMRAIHVEARDLVARGGELIVVSARPLIARMIATLGMEGAVTLEGSGP